MKLISCEKCGDIFNFTPIYKECSCGNAKGFYIDENNIVYSGENVILFAIDNFVFNMSKDIVTLDGQGIPLIGHICPYYTGSTIHVNDAKFYWHNRIGNAEFYWHNCESSGSPSIKIKEEWDRRLDNIRNTNIFKKLIYKLFKKYMFPSFPEYRWKKETIEWKDKK
jgi:hypothetical protein